MKTKAWTLATLLALAGCTDAPPLISVANFETASTQMLWRMHQSAPPARALAIIEAELGVRGQSRSGTTYLGRQTSTALGKSLYARTPVSQNTLNCDNFPTNAAAQKTFLAAGGPLKDPHGLDRDGDGLACEWGRTIQQIATTQVRSAYRPRPTKRCYTGPRGGTYTLTASGNKNYSGC